MIRMLTGLISGNSPLRRKLSSTFSLTEDFTHEQFTPTQQQIQEINRILNAKNLFEVLEIAPTYKLNIDPTLEDTATQNYSTKIQLLRPFEIDHPDIDKVYDLLVEALEILTHPEKLKKHYLDCFPGEILPEDAPQQQRQVEQISDGHVKIGDLKEYQREKLVNEVPQLAEYFAEDIYQEDLTVLAGMGFTDRQRNIELLKEYQGDLNAVLAAYGII
eukprot:maker-scaffold_56-snap-gene-1.63-mRNA-1 protein AED:0.02 eAED:0.02 QI:145/1/1/1/1/1/3/182/216